MYIISFIKDNIKQALYKPRQKNQPNFSLNNYKEKYDTSIGEFTTWYSYLYPTFDWSRFSFFALAT